MNQKLIIFLGILVVVLALQACKGPSPEPQAQGGHQHDHMPAEKSPEQRGKTETQPSQAQDLGYTPVITPNGQTLKWEMVDGVKVYRLSVDEIEWEIAPGMKIKAWGYNGMTPGPTIEAVEGDRVRIYVTNHLKEDTAVHWHGLILPSGMDGVKGLTQKGIPPGETFVYEFTLKQHGTQMYHSHGDEMVQIGMGTMGFFVIHPKRPAKKEGSREKDQRETLPEETPRKIDRDYAIFLNEWFVEPGTKRPNPNVMTDFNIFTFNSKAFPGTEPLVAQTGERVRIRFGNVSQECHPIHLHGHSFKVVATDGGDIPESAQWPETTVHVCPGQTRDVEFIANPGDWAFHCHRRHHPMNPMEHDIPNLQGIDQSGIERGIKKFVPGYMAMGEHGMDEHQMHAQHMKGPPNTLPMMAGVGPFGNIGMGGMFTVLKVRDKLKQGDEGWYDNPPGTVADAAGGAPAEEATIYTCPMHPEIRQPAPGKCPLCGMDLVPVEPKPQEKKQERPGAQPAGHEHKH
ncbi:MAG TPA: multicopper oxidase domain-containing protein [bacterium]|nr:multicopper oxidase domain-containing protein [bacterium]